MTPEDEEFAALEKRLQPKKPVEAEKQEPVELVSKTPPLYPMQKDGETFSVEYYEIDTHPQPKRTWVGLTQEELLNLGAGIVNFEYAAAIEAKLKEKNT